MRSVQSRRLSRRDITQERRRQKTKEHLKEFVSTSARGLEWTVLFFGLLLSLVIALVLFLAGHILYAIPFLLFGGFVGAALLKRDPSW
jgi:Flp pilus assembly protein TadB